MKKYCLLLGFAVLVSGCSQLDKYMTVSSNASAQEKFRACALTEANAMLQNGTLFTKSLTVTKDEIVSTCLKKMALEAAGIDSEAQTIATNVINALRAAQ